MLFDTFSKTPEPPVLALKSTTQTSAIIRWDPLVLHTADLRCIDVYRDGQKLSLHIPPTAASAKLSGLAVSQEYEAWIVVRTTAGHGLFESNHIRIKTHSMDNLTGIHVSFGAFVNDAEVEPLVDLLKRTELVALMNLPRITHI